MYNTPSILKETAKCEIKQENDDLKILQTNVNLEKDPLHINESKFKIKSGHEKNTGLNNNKCELCNKTFSHAGHLNRHIKTVHEKLKNYKCDFCDKAFGQPKNLSIHINGVHNKVKNYKCDQCDKAFSYRQQLKRHINNVHKRQKNHKCYLCDKAYSDLGQLNGHINSVHEGLKNYKCDICDKVFSQFGHLNVHILNTTHKKCDICDKYFSGSDSLQTHIKNNHKDIVECDFCDKIFDESKLKMHINSIHEEQKDFKCNFCNQNFWYFPQLKTHVFDHHHAAGLKKWKCDFCEKIFRQKWVQTKHTNVVHKSLIYNGNCKICGNAFSGDSLFHSCPIKKYKCHLCDKNFNQTKKLEKHIKNVHEEQNR